jgi:tetratricopeptide (TPR) repeat protein
VAVTLAAVLPVTAVNAEEQTLQGASGERERTRERLFAALAAAPNESVAREITDRIWRFWFEAPDAEAARLMREVQERRSMFDLAAALKLLDNLVEQAPGWAEAWNQRATIRYMAGDYAGSLADIDHVLPLEPKHFGALAGEALILMQLGRREEAQEALKRAVAIHPFLAERALLDPEPEGQDI